MKLVIFGLSISSSWGNGHATLWRGLCAALARRGHRITFFERDVPYYAASRDVFELSCGELILFEDWQNVLSVVTRNLSDCDVAIVTSYCPDALAATELMLQSRSLRCFYDMDSPVTLDSIERGKPVDYIGPRGLRDYDLVLSYAGGPALTKLRDMLGAKVVAPLYGSVDPNVHSPAPSAERFQADLSYLGTYAADRDEILRELFVKPASLLPGKRFVIGGSGYDESFPWRSNIYLMSHVPVAAHPAFYCSAKLNLNVTRRAMAQNGYCPSGRLFEAAACGSPLLSDGWPGLNEFFTPGREILIARDTSDVVDALNMSPDELLRLGRAARERTLESHTADVRVQELENILSSHGQKHAFAAAEVN